MVGNAHATTNANRAAIMLTEKASGIRVTNAFDLFIRERENVATLVTNDGDFFARGEQLPQLIKWHAGRLLVVRAARAANNKGRHI